MSEKNKDTIAMLLNEWRAARPDLDPSPVAIQGRIARLSAHFQRTTENWLEELCLTWEAFSLIVTLRRAGKPYELRPTDIQVQSLLTGGAITNRIDRVEELGLIERRPDKNDRRSYAIRLTATGKKLADEAIARHFASLDRALAAALSPNERTQLGDMLSKLLAAFEVSNSAEPPKSSAKPRQLRK